MKLICDKWSLCAIFKVIFIWLHLACSVICFGYTFVQVIKHQRPVNLVLQTESYTDLFTVNRDTHAKFTGKKLVIISKKDTIHCKGTHYLIQRRSIFQRKCRGSNTSKKKSTVCGSRSYISLVICTNKIELNLTMQYLNR